MSDSTKSSTGGGVPDCADANACVSTPEVAQSAQYQVKSYRLEDYGTRPTFSLYTGMGLLGYHFDEYVELATQIETSHVTVMTRWGLRSPRNYGTETWKRQQEIAVHIGEGS